MKLSTFGKHSIVRISTVTKDHVGLGVIISPKHIITCAHVVKSAINAIDEETNICIRAPFINDEFEYIGKVVQDGWSPKFKSASIDLALLELEHPIPDSRIALISTAKSITGTSIYCWGGIKGYEKSLIDFEGVVKQELTDNHYHLDASSGNYKIGSGCSGAPVFEKRTGLVVGIISKAERNPDIDAGFIIPASSVKNFLHVCEVECERSRVTGSRLQAVTQFVKGKRDISARHRNKIIKFISFYAGVEAPIPFAGRERELQELDEWVVSEKLRFKLVTGAAGRGKSALILHWIDRIINLKPRLSVIFLPISVRFNLSDELSGLVILYSWLIAAFKELRFPDGATPSFDDYRDTIHEGWELIREQESPYLLVIDGVDESSRHWILKDVLPEFIPDNLHILVSARHKPDQVTYRSWIQDFNIQDSAVIGDIIDLPTLSKASIGDAIIQLGRPLDKLKDKEGFIDQLFRLTDSGDPLLLVLWVGQLWRDRDSVISMTVSQIGSLQPSFEGFFNLWMDEQASIWESKGIHVHKNDLVTRLNVLCLAKSPLMLKDFFQLERFIDSDIKWDNATFREVLESTERLIVGDGKIQGYSFIHPKISFFLQDQLSDSERYKINKNFLDWGQKHIGDLNASQIAVTESSLYLLNHYYDHIRDSELTFKEKIDLHYSPMLENGWRAAWSEHEGVSSGYLSTIQDIVKEVSNFNDLCTRQARLEDAKFSIIFKAQFIIANITSSFQNLPVSIIPSLVTSGVWTIKRALFVSEHLPSDRKYSLMIALSQIADGQLSTDILQSVMDSSINTGGNFELSFDLCSIDIQVDWVGRLLEVALRTFDLKLSHIFGRIIEKVLGLGFESALVFQAVVNMLADIQRQEPAQPSSISYKELLNGIYDKEEFRNRLERGIQISIGDDRIAHIDDLILNSILVVPEAANEHQYFIGLIESITNSGIEVDRLIDLANELPSERKKSYLLKVLIDSSLKDSNKYLWRILQISEALREPTYVSLVLEALILCEDTSTTMKDCVVDRVFILNNSHHKKRLVEVLMKQESYKALSKKILSGCLSSKDDLILDVIADKIEESAELYFFAYDLLFKNAPSNKFSRAHALFLRVAAIESAKQYAIKRILDASVCTLEGQVEMVLNYLALEYYPAIPEILSGTLSKISGSRDKKWQELALHRLIDYLKDHESLLIQAFKLSCDILNDPRQSFLLRDVLKFLPDNSPVVREIVVVYSNYQNVYDKWRALSELLDLKPGNLYLMGQAFNALMAVGHEVCMNLKKLLDRAEFINPALTWKILRSLYYIEEYSEQTFFASRRDVLDAVLTKSYVDEKVLDEVVVLLGTFGHYDLFEITKKLIEDYQYELDVKNKILLRLHKLQSIDACESTAEVLLFSSGSFKLDNLLLVTDYIKSLANIRVEIKQLLAVRIGVDNGVFPDWDQLEPFLTKMMQDSGWVSERFSSVEALIILWIANDKCLVERSINFLLNVSSGFQSIDMLVKLMDCVSEDQQSLYLSEMFDTVFSRETLSDNNRYVDERSVEKILIKYTPSLSQFHKLLASKNNSNADVVNPKYFDKILCSRVPNDYFLCEEFIHYLIGRYRRHPHGLVEILDMISLDIPSLNCLVMGISRIPDTEERVNLMLVIVDVVKKHKTLLMTVFNLITEVMVSSSQLSIAAEKSEMLEAGDRLTVYERIVSAASLGLDVHVVVDALLLSSNNVSGEARNRILNDALQMTFFIPVEKTKHETMLKVIPELNSIPDAKDMLYRHIIQSPSPLFIIKALCLLQDVMGFSGDSSFLAEAEHKLDELKDNNEIVDALVSMANICDKIKSDEYIKISFKYLNRISEIYLDLAREDSCLLVIRCIFEKQLSHFYSMALQIANGLDSRWHKGRAYLLLSPCFPENPILLRESLELTGGSIDLESISNYPFREGILDLALEEVRAWNFESDWMRFRKMLAIADKKGDSNRLVTEVLEMIECTLSSRRSWIDEGSVGFMSDDSEFGSDVLAVFTKILKYVDYEYARKLYNDFKVILDAPYFTIQLGYILIKKHPKFASYELLSEWLLNAPLNREQMLSSVNAYTYLMNLVGRIDESENILDDVRDVSGCWA